MSQPTMTDRRCSSCNPKNGAALFLYAVRVEPLAAGATAVDVLACPHCDRVRCPKCGQPVGTWFTNSPPRCPHCNRRL